MEKLNFLIIFSTYLFKLKKPVDQLILLKIIRVQKKIYNLRICQNTFHIQRVTKKLRKIFLLPKAIRYTSIFKN